MCLAYRAATINGEREMKLGSDLFEVRRDEFLKSWEAVRNSPTYNAEKSDALVKNGFALFEDLIAPEHREEAMTRLNYLDGFLTSKRYRVQGSDGDETSDR
jgi:hypothetical protein